ncbi:chorismate mutase [Bartonella doshiae]|uniref:chorismate mutase n=2 Tax=Bartonella doshiae TaxID=33044 RepID=A0A380ZGX1_BARDO|nr:chorismate mutase [Bartonella doshiae]EJF80460.1 chorismate mutase [Bartonella doshiae NCTC 12862 = ATCC 700133]MBB6158765.1 chorismate mutase [Bartonella doshiae]SUV45861.1 T-protein [Bartonella doshiae]
MQEKVLDELMRLRASIDNFDSILIHILAERFRCTQEVGRLKAHCNLPTVDSLREQHQIARLRKLAVDTGLDPDFAEKFLKFIIQEVVRQHEVIAENHKIKQVNLNESQS